MTTQEAEAGAKAAPTVINTTAELIRREQEARKAADAAAAAIVAQYPDDGDLIAACGKLLQVFAAACLKIRTKQGGPLWPFVLNWIQLNYLTGLRELFTGGKGDFFRGIRDLIVKPRQLGFSTFIAALFFMDGFLEPGRISVIVTHDDKISQELLRTYRLFFDELPDQVKEGVSLSRASADTFELCFDGIPERSRFTIRTEKGTEWRGGTIHNLHCLSPDTLVVGPDGFLFRITEPPALVRDGNGSLIKVKGLSETDHKGEKALKITSYGNSPFPIICTSDHKILTREFKTGKPVWKEAGEVTKDDYIAFPITKVGTHKSKVLEIAQHKNTVKTVDKIEANRAFGELIGWYLAEGWIIKNGDTPSGFGLAVCQDEIEMVANMLRPLEDAGYFTSVRMERDPDSQRAAFTAYGRNFSEFLLDLVGELDGKRIPDGFFKYPTEFLKGLLAGILEGDGTFKDIRRVSFCTVRPQLAVQLKRLAINMRIGLPSIRVEAAGERYGRNCKERWTVEFFGPGNVKLRRLLGKDLPPRGKCLQAYLDRRPDSPKWNHSYGRHEWRKGAKHYWAKVTDIETVDAPEKMYDIVLDREPHSYTTIAGVVHNCSEAAFYENWSRFFASYVQAVPASGNIIFETTCNGRNEFYEEVMLALEGANGYRVIFYPWFKHPEYRRPWDEATQKPLTEEEKALMAKHGLDLEQIAWRRWKQGEVKDKFPQEYPESLLGAFLATGRPFFSLAAVDKGFEKAKAYWKGVEEGRIPAPRYPRPYVTIFEDPIPGELYIMPADIAEGIDKGPADGEKGGADFSYAPVIHVKTMRTVAIIHGRIPAVEFAEIYDRLGRLYQAVAAPERNNHGHTIVAALQKSEYPELYHHAEYNEEGKRFLKPGWPTNSTTRRPMLDALAHVIEREGFFNPDLGFWREADRFIRNPKTGKPEAMQFWHDDRVIGASIGVYLITLGRNEWGMESTEGRDSVGFPRLPGTYKGHTAAYPGTDTAPEPVKHTPKPAPEPPVDTPKVQAWASMRQAHAETQAEETLDRVLSPSPANLPGAPKALQSVGTTAGQSIVEAMQERNERRKRLCSMCGHCPEDPGTWCSHLLMRINPYDPACGAFLEPEEEEEDANLESDFGGESWK